MLASASGSGVPIIALATSPALARILASTFVPSTTLEAMGLVALEAQACGLPVLYQPVPGLTETLGDTALATDFTDAARLARELTRLRTDTDLLPTLGAAGPRNAARYPLSATGIALTTLAHRLG